MLLTSARFLVSGKLNNLILISHPLIEVNMYVSRKVFETKEGFLAAVHKELFGYEQDGFCVKKLCPKTCLKQCEEHLCYGKRNVSAPVFEGTSHWMLPPIDCMKNDPEFAFALPRELEVSGHRYRLAGISLHSEATDHFTAILIVNDSYVFYDGLAREKLTYVSGATKAMETYKLGHALYLRHAVDVNVATATELE